AADSTVSCSATFSLVIDASSMIGSYTERFTVPPPQTVQQVGGLGAGGGAGVEMVDLVDGGQLGCRRRLATRWRLPGTPLHGRAEE
ncbi:hypothetical protein, partial [Streptomyces collinus]|uniref:hypothetical protein n=1 Tax=Streptomyces collinus TaxID=42684 RepID=UPI0036C56022